jgi:hypothetical protein
MSDEFKDDGIFICCMTRADFCSRLRCSFNKSDRGEKFMVGSRWRGSETERRLMYLGWSGG